MRKLLKKLSKDNGGSELVSMLLISVLMISMLTTLIDVGVYMNNRALINSAARDGARTIAIMGGAGSRDSATPIENAYGLTLAETCGKVQKKGLAEDVNVSDFTPVECNILNSLNNSTGLVNVSVKDVNCTPKTTTAIGQRTSCEVKWRYNSLPGAPMGFIHLKSNDPAFKDQKAGMLSNNVTTGSSESEVDLTGVQMESRV